jgi:hypothetical protein
MTKNRELSRLILVLAAIALLPLWRCLFLGETLGAFDQIRQMAPWNGPKPLQPWDVLQADGVLQFYVWRDLVLDSWRHGQLPMWNPYQFGGAPLLANSQSGALYPPHIILGLLQVSTPLATGILAWFHLFWAGLGVALLVKRLTESESTNWVGPLVAGASFTLSPFMLGWLALSSVPMTISWIPWLLLGLIGAFSGPDRRSLLIVVGSTAMILLAGHLQFAAYAFLAAGACIIALLFKRAAASPEAGGPAPSKAKQAIIALGAVVIGVAVASPQLVPVLQNSKNSHRRNVPTEEGFAAYQGGALAPYELVGLVAPTLTGMPTEPVELGPETVSSYWPAFVKRGGNYAEGALGIGTLIFGGLLLLRRKSLGLASPILCVGLLGLLLAFGSPLGRLLYFGFPGWSSTGSPGRAIVLFVLAACVGAGVAISTAPKDRPYIPSGIAAIVLLLSVYFVKFGAINLPSWIPGAAPELIPTIVSSVNLGPALLAGILGVAGLALLAKRPQLALVGLAGSLIALPLVRTTDRANTDLTIDVPKEATVAFINSSWDLLQPGKALVPPNIAALSRVRDVGGYDSLINKDTVARLNDANGQDSAPPANGNMMFVKPTVSRAKLAAMGVTEVWSLRPLEGWPEPVERDGVFRYELTR